MNDKDLLEAIGQMIDQKIKPITQNIDTLSTTVTTLSTTVTTLSTTVTTLSTAVDTLALTVNQIQIEQQKTNQRLDNLETDLTSVKQSVAKIEHDHGEKLSALFDGYIQNSQKLDRIEQHVTAQDEIILRRVF